MGKRPWLYAAVGLIFGMLDWHYLDLLSRASRNPALNGWIEQLPAMGRLGAVLVMLLLNYCIWLVPVIPAAIYESRRSKSIRFAALAGIILWTTAMVGYYGYYTILLLFAGLPQMEFMLYANHSAPGYWSNFLPMFRKLIVEQFLMWVLIAVICGGAVGVVVGWLRIKAGRKELKTALR